MPEVAKDISSKGSEKKESVEARSASGSEATKKKAKLEIALDTSEKPAPIVGAAFAKPTTKENKSPLGSPTREKKKSPLVSPSQEKRSPLASPSQEKRSPLASPSQEKRSPLASPSQEKRSPLASPSQEKRSPLVSPTEEKRSAMVSPTQEKRSAVVSPTQEKRSAVVSPTQEKRSAVVSPTQEKRSTMVSTSQEQKTPLVSPSQEQESSLVSPSQEKFPLMSPTQKKFPLGEKVPGKEDEFVKPATGESITRPKIKQMGAPDPTTPSSPTLVVPGSESEYGSGVKEKSSDTVEPTSERSSSKPAVDAEGTRTEERFADGMYRCMFYMKHFRVDDISIQIEGQTVLIDAKHGYQVDEHGFVTREFVRKHVLPENVIVDKFTSCFTDGVLVIQAPHSKM